MLFSKGYMKYIIGLLLACLLVTSCVNYDSQRIQPTRNNYNEALQYGDKSQLLLNIVRIRYEDLPYFFSVNNIIAQINYSNTFTGGINNTWTPAPVNFSTSGSDSVTVGEAPTITYTPLQGDAFIKKMLTPVDLRVLYMMVHSTTADLERLLRVFVLRLGAFENNIADSSVAHNRAILNLEYVYMAKLLSRLIDSNKLKLSSDSIDEKFAVKLTLKGFNTLTPKRQRVLKKLGFSNTNSTIWVVQDKTAAVSGAIPQQKLPIPAPSSEAKQLSNFLLEGTSRLVPIPTKLQAKSLKPKTIVLMQTKPLFTILIYLSKGVSTPADEQNRTIVGTQLPNGKFLNWQFYIADLFDVHVCSTKPRDVFLTVRYRDKWYYIRDDDISTKATFYGIGILMNLYEGNVQNGLTPFYSIIT